MKPIIIDEQEKAALLKEFEEAMSKSMFQGTFTFTKKYTFQGTDKAHIFYTPAAFAKTVMLLKNFDSEVAWYCLVERGEQDNEFIVFDVLVYEQEVTGATVEADVEKFMIGLTDEQNAHLYCQCHSHVNMGTSPSSTDLTHQAGVVESMNGQGFYMFQIWNKRLETTNFIYDFDNNVYWENSDIDVQVIDEEWGDLSYFINDAKKIVTTKSSYASSQAKSYSSPSYPGVSAANNEKKSKKDKNKKSFGSYSYYNDDDDDYESGWSSNYYSSGY